jgi:prepilin-type N-terminal cleavage/methylation domain-containing protein
MIKLSSHHSGFTLVELAVVMIVIGLIIAGLLQSSAMITNAEIKNLMVTVDTLRTSARTFEDKYGSLPGDLQNADQRVPGCAANALCQPVGNGDGIVGTPRVGNWSRDDQSGVNTEATQFWVQLSLSDMIGGVTLNNGLNFGSAYPESPLGGGFHVIHAEEGPPNQANGHYFVLRLNPTGDPHPNSPGDAVLSPLLLSTIERDFDDNVPNRGEIIADNASDTCWEIATGQYQINQTAGTCITAFRFVN